MQMVNCLKIRKSLKFRNVLKQRRRETVRNNLMKHLLKLKVFNNKMELVILGRLKMKKKIIIQSYKNSLSNLKNISKKKQTKIITC